MVSCKKIRQKLSAYQDNELGRELEGVIKNHLDVCVTCKETYKMLLDTSHLVSSLPEIEPPARMLQQVLDRAAGPVKTNANQHLTKRRWRLPGLPVPAGMAALAGTGIVLGIMLGNLLSTGHPSRSLQPSERLFHQAPVLSAMNAFDSTPPGSFAGSYLKLVSFNLLTK